MVNRRDLQHRVITSFQRNIGNPILRRLGGQTLLETTGRVSGQPRITPIGGRRTGHSFWFVSEFGDRSQYVRNIRVDNRVRLRLRGQWYTGTAHLLPDDDAVARLKELPRYNSTVVRAFGTDLLTVRVDLDPIP
ncbi:nitroreductase family deazaflavin-dependent oxidoreductase [Nocardia terpenica]|uniref:nitroreductase/quinone reductase family protein n=1 Tax=Nocardia terpenica TaxID=455432 RepID=UPI001894402D|nr:nitroreductase/quinone reductase family protein [Nocardia terpenica]MBF6063593.1 nitroreductase family deazaflavin-dependent oxidoreductase [Nocardia terpenica]MBF6109398.1 nitroreductase family deazaflavin-dependent oxidoreductase [Nocardia terpenica]MBF6114142.1 nitroreductase family deazaflavin-dependent oxidoreductase [Nocardia terpenica]MBF6123812.1 nitroreductase family deazaflavin-dependent oxidoreductase [Nocardia terpenica]MBF6157143.1 nitroreductase family deazaflavin-dependent ox